MAVKDEFIVSNWCVELREDGSKRHFRLYGEGRTERAIPNVEGILQFSDTTYVPSFVRQQVERRWENMRWEEEKEALLAN